MTISSALSNAMTGLRAAGTNSETISANIANAMTPGYGVRTVSLSSSQIGGVSVDGIVRNVNPALLADRSLAQSALSNATDRTTFLRGYEDALGTPDNPNSLSSRIAEFESSLITASSRPDAPERLEVVVDAARDLTQLISSASRKIQESRSEADRNINLQVNQLNTALAGVKELNQQITRTQTLGGDTSALQDSRQALVEEISEIVSVRQIPRDRGQIALYSTGGAILLDGGAAEVEFSAMNQVTPFMTLSGGQLSGLTLNGYEIRTDSMRGALGGGSLGAQFEIRDEFGVDAQTQLDAFTRDLIERFQDPAVDATLAVGDAGLFTDAGIAFDPLNEVGLSERVAVNAAVDEKQGGEAWRVRDGINAIVQGDVGDSRLLQTLSSTMTAKRAPLSGSFGSGAFSSSNLLATLTSKLGADRAQAEQGQTFASTQFNELTQLVLADGVDTDQELQRLLLVEQAYAANARMISAADEMMQTILRI
ncbi:Flagellar hook-associated protein 1 [Roseobacter fucihabitans]|uniref:Flagellar hook-associated protein 1 n=1 Tax=Roseobacter fucihabitans TaxID=1537242 RepID=A0ABZ2BY11_9RHOB|nr:flagellar hook-associated protein FlgK [Roseobacter litoralis]MBC6963772.1 Flagellar hook-associated protein 1 [Roseobacter litoralis]